MKFVLWFVWAGALATIPYVALAAAASSSASTLQQQIDAHNAQISQLDQEIAQYQTQLDAASKKSQTLQNTLSQINLSIKKTTTSIKATQTKIGATQLEITQLGNSITTTQSTIDSQEQTLARTMRILEEEGDHSYALDLLSSGKLSQLWSDVGETEALQNQISTEIQQLSDQKAALTNTKTASEAKKTDLVTQQHTLQTQQGSLSATKKAQSDLLAQTKSQETTYQALINQKKAQEVSLQQALTDLQSQYNQAVNPNSYPPTTQGLLHWPIDGKIIITQYFGDTPFAQQHAPLYSGHGHDGVDIGVPIGTPVHAALTGVVLATGNTDAIKGCYSFGKWIMIKHNNGLNTMYAHLSEIDVREGQQVSTGDVIGYSGETGYATGPHLHFGVYVSAVTKIIPLGQATKTALTPCHLAVMPVPPVSGYLNPLNYLPAL